MVSEKQGVEEQQSESGDGGGMRSVAGDWSTGLNSRQVRRIKSGVLLHSKTEVKNTVLSVSKYLQDDF